MWEHFFTHENTVPYLYNTGILIHTKYPHPHAAVSIVFLLFLALLLHNVFSRKSSDDNCTITDGHFIFPECPGLAAQLSLASVVTKQRQSVFTIQHPIHSPALPILQHVLFNCDPCQYCVGTFSTSTTSLFILNLPLHQTCQEAVTSEQCVLNRSVSSSHDILVEFTQPDFFYCCCYGENCTERLLYTYHCTNTISNVCTRVCCYHGNCTIF